MKNNLNNSSSPVTGRRYWRSLDELADTPEFKDWLHREFPVGASEMVEDGTSRRQFLKIMSASFAFAGVAVLGPWLPSARRKIGTVRQAAGELYFWRGAVFCDRHAHAHRRDSARRQILRRPSGQDGRQRAVSRQQRRHRPLRAGFDSSIFTIPTAPAISSTTAKTVSREEALGFLDSLSKKFAANSGEGLAFLAESSTSPSRARLQKIIAQKFPKSQWFTYDAIDSGIHQRAATQAFGQPVRPVFHFDKAKVILSLDCDFLGGEDDAHNHIRKFAAGRKAGEGMSRLYAVESLFTLTGANADHRLRQPARV